MPWESESHFVGLPLFFGKRFGFVAFFFFFLFFNVDRVIKSALDFVVNTGARQGKEFQGGASGHES